MTYTETPLNSPAYLQWRKTIHFKGTGHYLTRKGNQMPLESTYTEKQLFDQLISSIVHSVWVGLGQTENPLSKKVEINLSQAATNIDMLDMLYKRMDRNLSEDEEQYMDDILREIKVVYIKSKDSEENKPSEDTTS